MQAQVVVAGSASRPRFLGASSYPAGDGLFTDYYPSPDEALRKATYHNKVSSEF